jgi:hypothetical protein
MIAALRTLRRGMQQSMLSGPTRGRLSLNGHQRT